MAGELMPPVVAQLLGDVSDFQAKMKSADETMAKTTEAGSSRFKKMGMIVAGGLAAGAAAAVAFGAKSLSTFEKVAGETSKLQRLTGESAEAMSGLRGAAQLSGVSVDTLTGAFRRMSKGADSNAKAFKDYGIATEDAAGNQRTMSAILGDVADKFSTMPNGIEKNALAMKLFGKQGLDMIPMLNKGSAGLDGLAFKASKYGLVLSEDNVAAYKKNVQAHRDMSAAWQGLQVQLGAHIMPIVAKVTTWFAETLPTAMDWVKKGVEALAPVFNGLKLALDLIRFGFDANGSGGTGFVKVLTLIGSTVRTVVEWVKSHWPEIQAVFETVASAIGTAVAWVATNVLPVIVNALQAVVSWVVEHWPQISATVMGVIQWISDNVVPVVVAIANGIVTGVSAVVDWVVEHWPQISAVIGGVFDWIKSNVVPIYAAIVKGIIDGVTAVVDWVVDHWPQISAVIGAVIDAVKWVVENVFVPAFKIAAELIGPTVKGIGTVIGDVVSGIVWVFDNILNPAWDTVSGAVQTVWDAVSPILDDIGTAFTTLGDTAKGAFDGVVSALKTAWNAVAKTWNATIGSVSVHIPDWVPGVGGNGFDGPKLPTLHTGGMVSGLYGHEVLAVLRAGEQVVPIGGPGNTTADRTSSSGGDTYVYAPTIKADATTDHTALSLALMRSFMSFVAQGGQVPQTVRQAFST
jgi:TP901 family phage tail tape measure protein